MPEGSWKILCKRLLALLEEEEYEIRQCLEGEIHDGYLSIIRKEIDDLKRVMRDTI